MKGPKVPDPAGPLREGWGSSRLVVGLMPLAADRMVPWMWSGVLIETPHDSTKEWETISDQCKATR